MCFCSCGREIPRFPLGMRSINKRGQLVAERLAWGTAVLDGVGTDWLREGEALRATLEATMHGDTDPRSLDESVVRAWQKVGVLLEAAVIQLGAPPINVWLAAQRGSV